MLLVSFITAMLGGVLTKIFHYKAIEVADLTRVTLVEQLKSLVVFFVSVFIIGTSLINQYQIIIGIVMLLCFVYFNYIDYKNRKINKEK